MFKLLIQCLKVFGASGLLVYLKLKTGGNRISLPGIKNPVTLRASNTDRITFKEIFLRREYDIKDLLGKIDIKTIVDAGANIGFTSVFLANQFPKAKIISIEPDHDNFNILESNIKAYPNITALQSAIWNNSEMINAVDRGYGKRGIVIEKNVTGDLQAISISELMTKYNISKIDILKMDIEGSEKEVFESNHEWLSHTKCLIIELHDRMKSGCSRAVFRALAEYDFSMTIKGENLVFTNNKYIN